MMRLVLSKMCACVCTATVLTSTVASAAPEPTPDSASSADAADPSGSAPADSSGGESPATESSATDTVETPAPGPSGDSEAAPTPPDEPPPNEQEAAALFREGSMYYELGQYDEAITRFEGAWKLAPVPQLLFNLGQAHRRWYEVDPNIDHLRQSRTFFVNYDKRMKTDPSYSAREADYVQTMIEKLDAQIELEEAKEAERNRVIVQGPTAADLEALEKRRIDREKKLATARRLNGSGIGFIVVGSIAAGVGIGGVVARTAYGAILDNSSDGDPNSPNLASADEDRRRRDGYLVSGQVGYGGLIAAAVLLPIGIGLRISGGVLERRTLATPEPEDSAPPDSKGSRSVAIEPTTSGLRVRF